MRPVRCLWDTSVPLTEIHAAKGMTHSSTAYDTDTLPCAAHPAFGHIKDLGPGTP